MENQVQQSAKNMSIKQLMSNDTIKQKFAEILGKGSASFISSVTTLATTSSLKDCDPMSILSSAIAGASLNLPVNPNLGFAGIVPFNSKSGKQAQFQIMTKGFVQLAQRSGQFLKLNVCASFEGDTEEQIKQRLFGIIPPINKSEKIVGYVAGFVLVNGYEQFLFMTVDQIQKHGQKYSKTYNSATSIWKTNFEAMAEKTVLKRLLSKFAPLSLEMQTAVLADQSKVKLDENLDAVEFDYVDSVDVTVAEEISENANKTTIEMPRKQPIVKEENIKSEDSDMPSFA